MTTLTFDNIHRSPPRARRPATRAPQVVQPVPVVAAESAAPVRQPRRVGTLALVAIIAALHVAGVVSLGSGTHTRAAHAQPQPIAIALVAPRVEPPPPPPPPKPRVQPPRAKAAVPQANPQPAPSTPVVASAPQASASADTVQVAPPAAAAPAPAPAAVEKVTEPRGYAGYLRNPAPAYPPAAQRRGLEGQVVLKVHVLPNGQPDSVTVARSSGHPILDDAALKAVMQWAF